MSQVLTVANVTLTNADQEYSHSLAARTSRLSFQCRTGGVVRYAFVTGKVASPIEPYVTLKSGQAFNENDLESASGDKVYFASSTSGLVMEIMTYE